MINKYERAILDALLGKYEKSKSFTGDNKVKQRFVVKIASLFPQYMDHSNFELFQTVNEAVDVLTRKSLILVKKSNSNVYHEVSLNIDETDQAYAYLGKTKKKDINNAILKVLDKYKNKNDIISAFCNAQVARMRANKSVQFFNEDLHEFDNLLMAVDSALKVESETFVRDFSVKIFNDSKVFDRISYKVEGLLYEYGDFPEKEQVLENLNIVRNPTYVNFKGAGIITIAGQRVDLSRLRSDIAVSSIMLQDIEHIEITGNSVMTVENLTSFHTTDCDSRFLIYLGGFHNKSRREFINKVFIQNPHVEFYHFGDIDAGGFYIYEHLKRLTGVNFKTYKMDLETLIQYRDKSKPLTENDKERLKRLKGNGFEDVIEYMLENNCKLEQEAIKA